jgi:uncharacterized protein
MLNINPTNKKMILSIDGGGMRGAVTLGMLAELEAQTGKPTHELFDMVAGTSTGAIIAAGLAVKMSATDILNVYKTTLPQSFGANGIAGALRYLLTGLRHYYDSEPFRRALQPLVQGKTIKDCTDPIILLTTKDVRTSNTYFIVSKGPGAARFADAPLSGAVAASGSAPIFFPPVAGNLVDGGVGVYGNPCLATAIEAMEYIGASEGFVDGNVTLISLGTGYPPNTLQPGEAARFWLKDWIEYIIGEGLDDSGLQQVFVTRGIYRKRIDFRRYNPLLTRENALDKLGVTVPANIDPAKLTLDSRALPEINLMEQIGRAYAQKLDWAKEDVMPWETVGGHGMPQSALETIDWQNTPYR